MRVSIRNEFLRLGLKEINEVKFMQLELTNKRKGFKAKADQEKDIELITQIDVFEEESQLDYRDIHDRFAMLDVDVKYPFLFLNQIAP